MFQDRAFAPRQQKRHIPDRHISSDRIETYISRLERRSKRSPRTAQQRLCASDELGHGERLDEVVICTCIKAVDAVLDRVARGQDENRSLIPARPHLSKKREAVAVRQAQIEDHGIVGANPKRRLSVATRSHRINSKSGFSQGLPENLRDPNLIFDNEEPHVLDPSH